MTTGSLCPVCNTRLFAFVRMRTNECVVLCPKCNLKKYSEGVGPDWETALKNLGVRSNAEQKSLL